VSVFKVDNAVILAAGTGSRLAPITYSIPKGLVPVKGEPLLERQIQQVKERGITEIVIVTGHLREKFDYLTDKFGVKIVFNPEYAVKNNLSSLYRARDHLKNSYILCADNWLGENIFNATEEKSWYSCVYKSGDTSEWCVTADAGGRIGGVTVGGRDSWAMYGPAFLSETFTGKFADKIEEYYQKPGKENYMWENVFIDEMDSFDLYINKQSGDVVYEIESLEELRAFDPDYRAAAPNAQIETIEKVFGVRESEIAGIKNIKTGMTNRSFSFSVKGKGETAYIYRLAGEGSEKLINRKGEKEAYMAVKKLGISDEIIHFDVDAGSKISVFYKDAANISARNRADLEDAMSILRGVHRSGIKVGGSFDIGGEIFRYLLLCRERNVVHFSGSEKLYEKMKRLAAFVESQNIPKVLCHVDSNPDNFIRLADGSLKLLDWEYAGMCDPVIDVSMYSIYSSYSKAETEELLEIYLQRQPDSKEFARLYAYAALGGYLWAVWAEYKQSFGVEFDGYITKMYRYARDFYDALEGFLPGGKEATPNER